MLKLNITAASKVGCVRDNNEDMLLVGEWFVRNSNMKTVVQMADTDRYMMALADGMGGHNSGEVASSETLHNLQFYFNDIPSSLGPGGFNETMCEWLESINHIIEAQGHEEPKYRKMGTTLVALAYYSGNFFWINCGDSRLYRLHDNGLTQLTTDHSLNNLLGSKEHTSVITNCIGGGCSTSYLDMMLCTDEVLPGDTFLLCSDGLSDMLSDQEIELLLIDGCDALKLCESAEDAGGFDNVSAIVIRVE